MDQTARIIQFETLCDLHEEIFIRKNAEYGNAIVETGVLGASIELVGAIARLRQLILSPGDGGEHTDHESLRNIFTDIHNYANIARMMMDEDNWTGKDQE